MTMNVSGAGRPQVDMRSFLESIDELKRETKKTDRDAVGRSFEAAQIEALASGEQKKLAEETQEKAQIGSIGMSTVVKAGGAAVTA
ncbi:MAG: hypothetical protein RL846_20690, partial [Deltaproteobacteria bacterium]